MFSQILISLPVQVQQIIVIRYCTILPLERHCFRFNFSYRNTVLSHRLIIKGISVSFITKCYVQNISLVIARIFPDYLQTLQKKIKLMLMLTLHFLEVNILTVCLSKNRRFVRLSKDVREIFFTGY